MRFFFILILLISQSASAVLYKKGRDGRVYILHPVPYSGVIYLSQAQIPPSLSWRWIGSEWFGHWEAEGPEVTVPALPSAPSCPVGPTPQQLEQEAQAQRERELREAQERHDREHAERLKALRDQAEEIRETRSRQEPQLEAEKEELKKSLEDRKAKLRAIALAMATTAVVDTAATVAAPFVAPVVFVGSAAVVGHALHEATQAVDTPHGQAEQEHTPEAEKVREEVLAGKQLHKIGTKGLNVTGQDSQYWAPTHPLTEPDYAERYGVPPKNAEKWDFLETGRMKPDGKFVTRAAPGVDTNHGGGIEVVAEPGAVEILSHTTLDPKKGEQDVEGPL